MFKKKKRQKLRYHINNENKRLACSANIKCEFLENEYMPTLAERNEFKPPSKKDKDNRFMKLDEDGLFLNSTEAEIYQLYKLAEKVDMQRDYRDIKENGSIQENFKAIMTHFRDPNNYNEVGPGFPTEAYQALIFAKKEGMNNLVIFRKDKAIFINLKNNETSVNDYPEWFSDDLRGVVTNFNNRNKNINKMICCHSEKLIMLTRSKKLADISVIKLTDNKDIKEEYSVEVKNLFKTRAQIRQISLEFDSKDKVQNDICDVIKDEINNKKGQKKLGKLNVSEDEAWKHFLKVYNDIKYLSFVNSNGRSKYTLLKGRNENEIIEELKNSGLKIFLKTRKKGSGIILVGEIWHENRT